MVFNSIFIILGIIFLLKGADFLVDGASILAKKFHIKEIVIGLTIVSIGTSLPELMISLTSALNNHADMAIGNVIGSNISNLFLILGICALIKTIEFQEETIKIEIPFIIFLTALLYIFGNDFNAGIITKIEGFILILFFVLFVIYNFLFIKKDVQEENVKIYGRNDVAKAIFKISVGIIGLKYGSDFVVNNASELAERFGISEQIISLTILAISTSLPELITSVTASLKGEINIAIGNIVGSNALNIALIIGITALITPVEYSNVYNRDIIFFILGMIMLFILALLKNGRITRVAGIIYVISYIMYMVKIVI